MTTEARARLLFLAPFPPQARGRHGGARATAELLRRVARRHRVAVLYLRDRSEPEIDPDIAALCDEVHAVARLDSGGGVVRKIAGRASVVALLLAGRPIWVQALDVPEFAARVRRFAREWRPDLVQLEYHVMGQYLRALDGSSAPRVLVVYEPGEDAAGRAWDEPSALLLRLDRRAWRIFERRILRDVQCVVALTDADRTSIARRGVDVPIETIGLGVKVPDVPADPLGSPPPTVLFVANFRHVPNADAGLRLVRGIWPLVRERRPDAVLSLVGEGPPAALVAATMAGVEVTGEVPEVEPFLERAAVCVAPLRQGGGMRVKVLEALAAGKAVVASPLAVAGLDVEDGRHLLIAATDEEFADAISRILDDPALRGSLAEAARTWAAANLGVERTAEAFETLYGRLIRGGP